MSQERRSRYVLGWFTCLIFSACSGTTIKSEPAEVTVPGIVSITSDWVKFKKDRFDAELVISNKRTAGELFIVLGAVTCSRGSTTGLLKNIFRVNGDDRLNLSAGESKLIKFTCKLPAAGRGNFKISFGKIMEKSGDDGKTAGKVLVDNLIWSQAE